MNILLAHTGHAHTAANNTWLIIMLVTAAVFALMFAATWAVSRLDRVPIKTREEKE